MPKTLPKKSKLSLRPAQIKKIFDLSSHLADFSEEILEDSGQFNKEFINGLNKSKADVKQGKIKELKSLAEIF